MNRLATLATLLVLAVAAAVTIVTGQSSQRQSAITGRLTNDTGQPIPNAGVSVRRLGSRTTVSRSAGTDEDGRFHVDDLPPGLYTVSAFTPGYVPATDSEEQPRYRAGDSVTLRYTRGGVITGTVTNAQGEPVIGVRVVAIRVRDSLGRQIRVGASGNSRTTDDRGVYRVFGLSTGTYVVMAGGGSTTSFYASAFDGDAPTYYPSTTRDAAGEVAVRAGDETTGIDIRYRADHGYAVSGAISGAILSSTNIPFAAIYLAHASTGSIISSTSVAVREGTRGFAIPGVPDGEYDLFAQLPQITAEDTAASLPRRVTVKGADVTGIPLELAPLGSISGRVVVEKLPEADNGAECKDRVTGSVDETLISARRDEPPGKGFAPISFAPPDGASDQSGEFRISHLTPARYRIETRLPSEHWFVRSIVSGAAGGAKPTTAVSNQGIAITTGQRVTGLVVTIAEGAAAVRGKVTTASPGNPLPERVRVYLVPAEPDSVEDMLRYAETEIDSNAAFAITNIAPGKYYLLSREPAGEQATERNARPVAWDAAARATLRQQAISANQIVELGRCQRVVEYELKYTPSSQGGQRPRRKTP